MQENIRNYKRLEADTETLAKRVEELKQAFRHLKYEEFLSFCLMGSLKRENQQAVLPMVSILIGTVQQMLELEKKDIDIAMISIYVDIQDKTPLKNFTKLSNFLQKASKLSNQLQNSNINIDDKNSLLDELSIAIDDFSSFAEAEYNYLSVIYDKLVNCFRNDKILHKLIDKV